MEDELARLKVRALELAEAEKARRREHYRLARQLGFSAPESLIMAGWSRGRITAMAERKAEYGVATIPPDISPAPQDPPGG